MMESRKRPFTDDGEVTHAKKRVLTGVGGSPQPSDVTVDAVEPTADDQLEVGKKYFHIESILVVIPFLCSQHFRKDAIFRRMRHYSRENERSQVRIAQLEQRKSTCEAGLVAIAACWEQVRCLISGL
jgi:E3 ubiquitin-protein ligase BRE1